MKVAPNKRSRKIILKKTMVVMVTTWRRHHKVQRLESYILNVHNVFHPYLSFCIAKFLKIFRGYWQILTQYQSNRKKLVHTRK